MAGMEIQNFIDSLEKQYLPRAKAVLVFQLGKFAEAVLGEAKNRCPYATGFLSGSGTTEGPIGEGLESSYIVGFNAIYAAAVHEILTNHHSQGEAKFLENALREWSPKLVPWMVEALEKEFANG
jgi:hypothetical protein